MTPVMCTSRMVLISRVLLVSPEGNIKRKLIETPKATHWIGFIEALRLVVHIHSVEEKSSGLSNQIQKSLMD